MRNVLAHAGKQGRRVGTAFIGTAFAQDDAGAAKTQWRQVADPLRPRVPKLAAPDERPAGFTPRYRTTEDRDQMSVDGGSARAGFIRHVTQYSLLRRVSSRRPIRRHARWRIGCARLHFSR
jgi:hypothetical protein